MKIFVYGFVWKSMKQLRSVSKQRKILHLEHCNLQVILHNLHRLLLVVGLGQCATWSKRTSVTGNARVGFLSVVGASKLLLLGVILSYYMDSLCWQGLEHLIAQDWSFCGFPFWRKWQRYRIQALIFVISMRCQNIFWYQRTVFDTMIATCPPGRHLQCYYCIVEQFEDMECFFSPYPFQLPNWLNSNKVWCEISHAIIDPLHSHYFRIAITTVIHSAFAIFHKIFVCIKRTTSQKVQSNCTNSIYSSRSKVM